MISLKRSLDEHDAQEKLFRTALNCYAAAIQAMESYALTVCPAEAGTQEEALRSIRIKLAGRPSAETLERTRTEVEGEMRTYHQSASVAFKHKSREIKEILRVLADAARTITEKNNLYADRLKGFATEMESLEKVDNLTEIHSRLARKVTQLKGCVNEMHEEGQGLTIKLTGELESFRRRLQDAEAAALTDPLTGAYNRRAMERQLRSLIEADRRFCIVLFDLDQFKTVNMRFGHLCGDAALKQFADRLKSKLRPDDMVCRWGGDEFLVFLECGMKDAMPRARQIAEALSTKYVLLIDGREVRVDISVSAGVAEYHSGESGEKLFERADSLLFHRKTELAGNSQ